MDLNAVKNSFDYGEFILPKKKQLSQKIDESQGSFIRVKPKLRQSIPSESVEDVLDALPPEPSKDVADFILEEPKATVLHRSPLFLPMTKNHLNLKRLLFGLPANTMKWMSGTKSVLQESGGQSALHSS